MAAATSIEAVLLLRDQMSGGLRGVNAALSTSVSRTKDVQRSMSGLIKTTNNLQNAIVGAAAAFGGFKAIKGVLDIASDFENTTLVIAGTLKAFKLAPTFTYARMQAKEVYDILNEMAAKLPGELEQYAVVFKAGLGKMIASGMTDIKKMADFSSRFAALAIANQLDAQHAGRDLMLLLAGKARITTRMFTILSEHIGMSTKEFNKLGATARRLKIDDAIRRFDDLMAAFAGGFEAKLGEVKSRLREVIRLGSEPFFEAAKYTLGEISNYLVKNKDTVVATIKLISKDFVEALGAVLKGVMWVARHAEPIYKVMKDIGYVIVGLTAASVLGKLISGFSTLLTLSEGIAVAMGMSTGGVATVLGALASAGVVAGAGYMAFKAAQDSAAQFSAGGEGDFEKQVRAQAQKDATATLTAYKTQSDVSRKAYDDMMSRIYSQSGLRPGAEITAANRAQYMGALASALKASAEEESLPVGQRTLPTARIIEALAVRAGIGTEEITKLAFKDWKPTAIKAPPMAPDGREKKVYDFRYSKFDIKQDFAEGFDPDRIAVAFATDLGRLGELKTQSAYSPLYAVGGN